MNSDEFGQVLRREREPGAVVKVRYCRSDPELDTFHSIIHSKTKIWSKMWDPWNMLTNGLGHAGIFVEMPQLNTTTLAPIMQSCPSAIMLVLLTVFTNQRVFLKTGSPKFRN